MIINGIDIWKNLKALNICVVVRSLLWLYVEKERFIYDPKNKFEKGDNIKFNWKYRYYLNNGKKDRREFIFEQIDNDNVVDTKCGEALNLYWLKKC
tara:strand:+ start:336 stop:623 length:288 start_codon:yes stop_codon:yes gene_type:complete